MPCRQVPVTYEPVSLSVSQSRTFLHRRAKSYTDSGTQHPYYLSPSPKSSLYRIENPRTLLLVRVKNPSNEIKKLQPINFIDRLKKPLFEKDVAKITKIPCLSSILNWPRPTSTFTYSSLWWALLGQRLPRRVASSGNRWDYIEQDTAYKCQIIPNWMNTRRNCACGSWEAWWRQIFALEMKIVQPKMIRMRKNEETQLFFCSDQLIVTLAY